MVYAGGRGEACGGEKNGTCHVILRRPWAQLRMVARTERGHEGSP